MGNLAKTFLAIGIAIVFTVFIAYGTHVFYEKPNNTCWQDINCGRLTAACYGDDSVDKFGERSVPGPIRERSVPIPIGETEETRECVQKVMQSDEYKQCLDDQDRCNEEYKSMEYIHARNSFFVLAVIAIISIVVGFYFSYLEGIGSGILGGGVLLIIWSLIYTSAFWETWNRYVKLFALFIVLVLLIFLGYKKLEKHSRKHH